MLPVLHHQRGKSNHLWASDCCIHSIFVLAAQINISPRKLSKVLISTTAIWQLQNKANEICSANLDWDQILSSTLDAWILKLSRLTCVAYYYNNSFKSLLSCKPLVFFDYILKKKVSFENQLARVVSGSIIRRDANFCWPTNQPRGSGGQP